MKNKALFSSLGLFALTITCGVALAKNQVSQVSHAEEATNLGTVELKKIETWNVYGGENNNEWLWMYFTGVDYPDVDGTNGFKVETRILDFFMAQNPNSYIEFYEGDNKIDTNLNVAGGELYVNMWQRHPVLAACFLSSGGADKIIIKEGLKIPSYSYVMGGAASYYTIGSTMIYSRKTSHHSNSEGDSWSGHRTVKGRIDLADELNGEDVIIKHSEPIDAGSSVHTKKHWLYFTFKTINFLPDEAFVGSGLYYNDHETFNAIDLMSYVKVNGVSLRDIVRDNVENRRYYNTCALYEEKGLYGPVELSIWKDSGMANGCRMDVCISTEYIPNIEGTILTISPFDGYLNNNQYEIYLENEYNFYIKNDSVAQAAKVKFGDTVVYSCVGETIPSEKIPTIPGGSITQDDEFVYTKVWKIKGTDEAFTSTTVVTGDMECEISEGSVRREYELTYVDENNQTIKTTKVPNAYEFQLDQVPSKKGYTGAWTSSDVVIANNRMTMPTKNVTVKLAYTPNKYTLSFEGIENTIEVTYDSKIGTLPAVPNKEGFENGKWMLGDEEITAETVWNFIEDKQATASYTAIVLTVTIDPDNGSETTTLNLSYGQVISAPTAPIKSGYRFAGWCVDGVEFDFSTPITSSITLKAKWIKQITVTFDSNGGSELDEQVIDEGTTVTKPNDPTRTGYEFLGWYNGDEEFDFSTVINNDLTLTAKWKKLGGSGCGGSIIATSGLISITALIGVGLLTFKKKEY